MTHCRSHMSDALKLMASRRIRPELVTSELVSWADAVEALAVPSLEPVVLREGDATASPGETVG